MAFRGGFVNSSVYLSLPARPESNSYDKTYQNLSENYEKYNKTSRKIIFTGHSSGGGLAKYLGMKYNNKCLFFWARSYSFRIPIL